MNYLLCTVSSVELAALLPSFFSKSKAIPLLQPIPIEIRNTKIFCVVTGPGPINAALGCGFALGTISETISGILNVGLGSSFNLDIAPLKSIWIINHEIWPEYGLNDGARITAKAFSIPLWVDENLSIYDELDLNKPEDLGFIKIPETWGNCSAITVAGATASFVRRNFLWDEYHALIENMEGFAIAYSAKRKLLPVSEIRVISNKTGPRSREEKDQDGALETLSQILPALGIQ